MKILRHLLPIEWITLAGMACFLALFSLFDYPPVIPPPGEDEILTRFFGSTNYLVYISLSAITCVVAIYLRRRINPDASNESVINVVARFTRMLMSFAACLYLMLTFKWWSHLSGRIYDALYLAIDEKLGGYGWVDHIADILKLDHILYFETFSWVFMVVYLFFAATRYRLFEKVVTANAAIALFGGIGYMIAPAYGPFIYLPVEGDLKVTQEVMFQLTKIYAENDGAMTQGFMVAAVLGAMPSLHVAHTYVLNYYVYKWNKYVGWLMLLFSAYITLYAVATRFHYYADLLAGLILAILCVTLVEHLFSRCSSKSAKTS